MAVDRRRARSVQTKLGPSAVGTCRREAGYSHHRTKPSNPENLSSMPAVVGTWMHAGGLAAIRDQWGAVIEVAVEDDELKGHIDIVRLPEALRSRLPGRYKPSLCPDVVEIEDLKTKRDQAALDRVMMLGPKRAELYQVHLYADLVRRGKVKSKPRRQAALAGLGPLDVQTVRLRYVDRISGENEYVHQQPYDEEITQEAKGWLRQITASTSPEQLPRDEDGPGLSIICDNCPFVDACWGTDTGVKRQAILIHDDVQVEEALQVYHEQRAIEAEAKAKKDMARAMLDGSEPGIYGEFKLGWSGGGIPKNPKPKVDVDRMTELFAEAGLEIPYLPPKPSARSINVVAGQ